jgi:hypothetical protein
MTFPEEFTPSYTEEKSVGNLFIFLKFCYCCAGVHCGIYKSSYNISNISKWNSPPPPFSFIPSAPLPGIVSTGLSFPLTCMCKCMCTQYLYYIHSPTPFPHTLSPPTGTNPPDRTCSLILFFKKSQFCLFKITTQGVSL